MERKLSSQTVLIGFISLILFFALTTFAQAVVQTWTGPVNFKIKVITNKETTPLTYVDVTSTVTFVGTLNFYWDTSTDEPTTGGLNNCFIEFLGNDGTDVCIKYLIGTGTHKVNKAKQEVTVTPIVVGEGTFNNTNNGYIGVTFLIGKGSFEITLAGLALVKMGGKVGGGFLDSNSHEYIFSGTVPATTLTLSP